MSSLPPEPSPVSANDFTPPYSTNDPSTPSTTSVMYPPPPPPPPQSDVSPTRNNTTLVALGVGVGIGGAIVLLAVGIFVFWYKRRKRKRLQVLAGSKDEAFGGPHQQWHQSAPPPTNQMAAMLPKPFPPPVIVSSTATFTYEELARATDSFSKDNYLGEGGFGYVHKGMLPNGKEVAVKQLKVGSGQGEREFHAEVEIISRVHHRHLVSLVGYCISGDQRMLVYEFVPNSTLEFHLHGKGRPALSWATRMKIATDSARGLANLHEDCHPKIIHRDIKASNILLDYNFEAKVADFGLARLNFDTDTHVSTRVMGTFGYLAPEYALTGKLTDKSDVFSYGVMLLELITGRRPIDKVQFLDDNIVDWARPLLTQALEEGKFDTLADPRLQDDYDSMEMTRIAACAAVCVRHLARCRPRMSQVVQALEGKMPLDDLNEGITPGQSSIYGSHKSSNYETSQYKEDLKKFQRLALETQDHDASEYSGPTITSEYGHRPSLSSSEVLQTTQEIGSSSEDNKLGRNS